MGESGANCVQQVAFTLADRIEYIKAAISAGLKIDGFVPRLSFFFGIGMDLFMNAAMLRAARYLWSEAVSGFGAQDPYNNVIRTTIDHCAHPMCRDYLHRYLENASGGHIHHDLSHVFDLHRNLIATGSMLG